MEATRAGPEVDEFTAAGGLVSAVSGLAVGGAGAGPAATAWRATSLARLGAVGWKPALPVVGWRGPTRPDAAQRTQRIGNSGIDD